MARELEHDREEAQEQPVEETPFLHQFREKSKDSIALALWLVIAVKTMIIGGFTSAYVYLVDGPRNPDYVPPAWVETAPYVNAGLLLLTWILVWMAVQAVQKKDYRNHAMLLTGAFIISSGVLVYSLMEYIELLGQKRAAHIALLALHIWFMILGAPALLAGAVRGWRQSHLHYLDKFTAYLNVFYSFVFGLAVWIILIAD